MNDSELDALMAASAPIHDADVARLPLSGSHELCEAIMSTPVIRSIETSDASGSPDAARGTPAAGGARERPHRRWSRPRTRLAIAGAAAAGVAAVAFVQPFGSDGGSAWAAEAVQVAESVPRLLITADGWEVGRADEFSVGSGDVTFRGPSGGEIDLRWTAESSGQSYGDFIAGVDKEPFERLDDVEIEGQQAALFEAFVVPGDVEEGDADEHTVVALWRDSGYVMGLESHMSTDRFLDVAASIGTVDVDTWLAALPESVVKAGDRPGAVQQMLADVPVPDGFDASSLETADVSARSRYQLGADVTGQVACAWVAQWNDGKASGDAAVVDEAVTAMGTARDWDILREMDAEGDWPKTVWDVADAMAAGDTMDAGRPDMPLAETAANALGCEIGGAPIAAG
jgi:hypothetical protein